MKYRLLIAVVALLAAVGSAGAAETLTAPDTDGCQLYMPYVWTKLGPGQTWSVVVELSQCPETDLGWFRFYGHINQGKRFRTIKVSDGITLSVRDMGTSQVFTHSVSGRKSEEYVLMQVDDSTRILLTATNETNKTKKVRMTWLSMTY
jgi:hypothetical protein